MADRDRTESLILEAGAGFQDPERALSKVEVRLVVESGVNNRPVDSGSRISMFPPLLEAIAGKPTASASISATEHGSLVEGMRNRSAA